MPLHVTTEIQARVFRVDFTSLHQDSPCKHCGDSYNAHRRQTAIRELEKTHLYAPTDTDPIHACMVIAETVEEAIGLAKAHHPTKTVLSTKMFPCADTPPLTIIIPVPQRELIFGPQH